MVEPWKVMIAGVGTGAETGVGAGLRLIEEEPMNALEAWGSTEMGVPDIIIGGDPGLMVCVPMTKFDCESAVIADPATVITGGAGFGAPGFGIVGGSMATVVGCPPRAL